MGMTKREKEMVEELRRELRETKALRHSGLPPPDTISPPDESGVFVNGWLYNRYSRTIDKIWTTASNHGWGHRGPGEPASLSSQGGISLYATRLDALIALRLSNERDMAAYLADLDSKIEAEKEAQ